MITDVKSVVYKRILLKLSGEALQGKKRFGIDANVLGYIAQEIKELVELNVQIGIVIGGGNLFRGAGLEEVGMNRVVGDHIGMLATMMNGLAVYDALRRSYINTYLMSSIPLNGICDGYCWTKAIELLCSNYIVIFCGGTGNPFFTTDSAACLRGIEIKADIMLKATKVDGVFTTDPKKDQSAIMYDQLSYSEVIRKQLKVMDLSAFTLAYDYKLPIRVFNMNKSGALLRIILGEKEGTLIT